MKMKFLLVSWFLLLLLSGCSITKQISRKAKADIIYSETFSSAHTGISIYEPATGKYWYDYQGNKYFVPASNTKIPTCYAALKHLGDSLVGLRYQLGEDAIYILPTGDPTFLHPDFKVHRVYDFLKNTGKKIILNTSNWQDERWGSGWSWNDYSESYMAERSVMPVYGNVVRISNTLKTLKVSPDFFFPGIIRDSSSDWNGYPSSIKREITSNKFFIESTLKKENEVETPFYTGDGKAIYNLLADTLHRQVYEGSAYYDRKNLKTLAFHSQSTDSLFKITMHRSDNFFAEQALLMVSNEILDIMNDEKIIDTLLKTDFKDIPQKPRWVDGSGLSRYNLFTPRDFVWIFNRMENEFGLERVKNILPTGGSGTLSSYYKADSNYIFAKTGTLSGVVALSGFLYTKKNKLLIFSVLVNNHHGSATNIRRAVEKFLMGIRNRY